MKKMSFYEHLEELRVMAIRVLFILAGSFIICYSNADLISKWLLAPLREALQSGPEVYGKIVYLGLLDKVLSEFQVSFWSSVIFSSPFWFYQIWLFLKPALYEKEQKIIKPFLLAGFIFFALGISFGYFIVFPFTFKTIMSFGVDGIEASISLKDYLLLSSKILVFLGFMFQLPNIMLILGFMELVTKQSLRQWRSYVYVGFSVLSAILTPPDIITMLAMWFPLIALYEIGILAVAMIVHPYLHKKYA